MGDGVGGHNSDKGTDTVVLQVYMYFALASKRKKILENFWICAVFRRKRKLLHCFSFMLTESGCKFPNINLFFFYFAQQCWLCLVRWRCILPPVCSQDNEDTMTSQFLPDLEVVFVKKAAAHACCAHVTCMYLCDGQPAHDGVPLQLCQYSETGE